jgi:hypothetical protein
MVKQRNIKITLSLEKYLITSRSELQKEKGKRAIPWWTKTIYNFVPLGSTPLSVAWMLNLSGSQGPYGKVAMNMGLGGHHV